MRSVPIWIWSAWVAQAFLLVVVFVILRRTLHDLYRLRKEQKFLAQHLDRVKNRFQLRNQT